MAMYVAILSFYFISHYAHLMIFIGEFISHAFATGNNISLSFLYLRNILYLILKHKKIINA